MGTLPAAITASRLVGTESAILALMLSRPRGLRVAILVLAVALATPGTAAAFGNGTARQPCKVLEHDCADALIEACCCSVDQSNPSVPASPPIGRATSASAQPATSPVPAFLTSSVAADDFESLAGRPHSPPHGYRFDDLSILLSVFLI